MLESAADELTPALSPDGRWLAYVSNESGSAEVYVRSFPGMGSRYQVSDDGGTEPVWSPKGDEIFYRRGSVLVAAAVRAGAELEVARRTALFSDDDFLADLTHQTYDVSPDGRHFLMVRDRGRRNFLRVTLNRFQHLAPGEGGQPEP